MERFKKDCCFCQEFRRNEVDGEIKEKYSVTNRILFDNNRFVVLPSVSPVVENHVLVLPKRHINTMKQLTDDEKDDLFVLVKNITQVFSGSYFLFEHGAFPANGNTCGVDHAHIHILPVEEKVSEAVIGLIKKSYYAKPYANLLLSLNDEKDMPYLLCGKDTHDMYSCNNANFPSQFMRKILCGILGKKEWNWRDFTNRHYFTRTVSRLKGKIHE
jgi:diadenosine tetraphosphate (Ap4A) HIT family hydrolase